MARRGQRDRCNQPSVNGLIKARPDVLCRPAVITRKAATALACSRHRAQCQKGTEQTSRNLHLRVGKAIPINLRLDCSEKKKEKRKEKKKYEMRKTRKTNSRVRTSQARLLVLPMYTKLRTMATDWGILVINQENCSIHLHARAVFICQFPLRRSLFRFDIATDV